YGSTLALELLRIDPDGIRSSIIDGIAPVDYPDDFAAYGKIFTRALTQLQMACNDDEACRDEFPDMAGDVRAAMSTVREAPVVIEDAIDPEAFPSGSATFFHDSIGGLAFISLYGSRTYPNLPAMIAAAKAAAEEGSLDERMRFLTGMSGDVFGDFAEGMSIAVTCQLGWNDNAADARAADVAAYPELSGIVSTDVLNKTPELCREFGLLARETTPLDTDVPTFIANGQIDPITPPEFAEYILPGFSQAQYIEVPYAGHGPTADDETCMSDVMRAFLDAPTDELDMTCLEEEIEAPAFVGPMWRTQGVTNVLADSFDEGKKGLLLGGLGAISTLGFVVLTLGGLARVANPSDYSVGADMGGGRTLTWLATALVAGGLGTVAYGAYSLSETLPFALIFGLPGYTRWGAVALVVAALPALLALFQLVRHLFAPRLPVGTFFGTLILNVAVVGVVAMAIMVGFAPWAG
ncbi:MAG: alpha/beta hydrolase, partial [Pseudomonadota bacterium]